MSDRSPDGPLPDGWVPPPADATRDITLPPLPDRPAPAVRPEWVPYVPVPEQAAPAPGSGRWRPDAEPGPDVEPRAGAVPSQAGEEAPRRPPDQPTDRLTHGQPQGRSTTLSFQPPPPVELLKVSVGARRRRGRWLWAVAILVPLLLIAGSGIWLFVLLYGG